MKAEELEGRIKVLKKISADMKSDAEHFDGKPFNGKVVAQYFGYQGAAIAATARMLGEVMEHLKEDLTKCPTCGSKEVECRHCADWFTIGKDFFETGDTK